MPDLIVRRNIGGQTQQPLAREMARPFRGMRDLLRWDPFQDMAPVWPGLWSVEEHLAQFTPPFEVKETKAAFIFKADVPGVTDQDIEVSLTGNRLTISARREEEKQEQNETFYSCERTYGSFSRSFTLPEETDAEHLTAELKAGVLTLVAPKQLEAQPKKIAVKSEKKPARA